MYLQYREILLGFFSAFFDTFYLKKRRNPEWEWGSKTLEPDPLRPNLENPAGPSNSVPMGSSLCVASSLQSVVQTPSPATRGEERERTRENNKDNLTMEGLEGTECVCSKKISVLFSF